MGSETRWRGQRDARRSRLWAMLVVSLLLHLPLTPVGLLAGLVSLLWNQPPPPEVVQEITPAQWAELLEIPVEVEPEPEIAPSPSHVKAISDDDTDDDDDEPDPLKRAKHRHDDGGVRDAGTEASAPDAAPADAAPNDAAATASDAGAPSDAGADAEREAGDGVGKTRVEDPVALSGRAAKVADANANVRLLIFTDRIRNHPMGARIGDLLRSAQQWKSFLGPGKLDPIRDFDRILIVGPQLRNSSEAVAVLRYRVPQKKVKDAVDSLVERSNPKGRWLETPMPVAVARADRAERLFAMPAPGLLVIAPPAAQKAVLGLDKATKFPKAKGGEALVTYVRAPWRAFTGVPFSVPKTIVWVKMSLVPTSDGGAVAQLVAEDESEEAAKQNAEQLTRELNAVTQIKLGVIGSIFGKAEHRLIEPVQFEARGKNIEGTVTATPRQLRALLESIAAVAEQIAQERAEKEKLEKEKAEKAAKPKDEKPKDEKAEKPKEQTATKGDAG